LDEVIADINKQFESLKTVIDIISVLWELKYMSEGEIKLKSRNLVVKYNDDLLEDLVDELQSLNIVYAANFGHKQLNPLELLNYLQKTNLASIFPNCITNLFNYSYNSCEYGTIFLDIEGSEECITINNDTTETIKLRCFSSGGSTGKED
jgi:hypothetical protein